MLIINHMNYLFTIFTTFACTFATCRNTFETISVTCTLTCEAHIFNDLQLYLISFKRSDGMTFSSVCFRVSFPFDFFHPHCKGLGVVAGKVSQVIVYWCILRIWLMAVPSVCGRFSGFTSPFAFISINLLYLESTV